MARTENRPSPSPPCPPRFSLIRRNGATASRRTARPLLGAPLPRCLRVPHAWGGGQNPESDSQARLADEGFAKSRTGAERKTAQSLAARGPGFDPSRQGPSPNEVDPGGFTKEGSTGIDRSGEVI